MVYDRRCLWRLPNDNLPMRASETVRDCEINIASHTESTLGFNWRNIIHDGTEPCGEQAHYQSDEQSAASLLAGKA